MKKLNEILYIEEDTAKNEWCVSFERPAFQGGDWFEISENKDPEDFFKELLKYPPPYQPDHCSLEMCYRKISLFTPVSSNQVGMKLIN